MVGLNYIRGPRLESISMEFARRLDQKASQVLGLLQSLQYRCPELLEDTRFEGLRRVEIQQVFRTLIPNNLVREATIAVWWTELRPMMLHMVEYEVQTSLLLAAQARNALRLEGQPEEPTLEIELAQLEEFWQLRELAEEVLQYHFPKPPQRERLFEGVDPRGFVRRQLEAFARGFLGRREPLIFGEDDEDDL